MRYFLSVMFAMVIAFSSCKKDSENADQLLTSMQLLASAQDKFLELGQQGTLTAQQALMETATWLQGQDGVASVQTMDSLYLSIEGPGGIVVKMQVSPLDSNGLSLYRGGGGGADFKQFAAGGSCSNKLVNKKVLLYAPFNSQFYGTGELAALATTITNGGNNLQVTTLTDAQCTADKVKDFANYGLVIMDTHGQAEGFATGSSITFTSTLPKTADELKTQIINTLGQDYLDKILSGDYYFNEIMEVKNSQVNWLVSNVSGSRKYSIYVSSKYIKTLPQMTNTIIFGNMCYSGYGNVDANTKNPIRLAWMSLNPVSYYAYAQPSGASTPVDNDFARDMENKLVQRLVINQDSTKIAYLKTDNVTEYKAEVLERNTSYKNLYFKHFGKDTYCYGCGGDLTDTRDGQVYKTVCIGGKVWMAQNLNYDAPGSVCYDGNAANCNTYGRLYDFSTVMAGAAATYANPSGVKGVCPNGWHIPSESEWQVMLYNFGADSVAGAAIRDTVGWDPPNTGATNVSGFNGKPAGYFDASSYTGLGTQATWWSTTPSINDTTYAIYVETDNSYKSVTRFSGSRSFKLSCRCVQD